MVIVIAGLGHGAAACALGQGATTTLDARRCRGDPREVPGVAAVVARRQHRARRSSPRAGNWSTQIQGDWRRSCRRFGRGPSSAAASSEQPTCARAAKVAVLGEPSRAISCSAPARIPTGADRSGSAISRSRVIGVLARKGQSAMGRTRTTPCIVPYTTVQKRSDGVHHRRQHHGPRRPMSAIARRIAQADLPRCCAQPA